MMTNKPVTLCFAYRTRIFSSLSSRKQQQRSFLQLKLTLNKTPLREKVSYVIRKQLNAFSHVLNKCALLTFLK